MASEIIERTMYGGTVEIIHNPNARGRAPRYMVNGTQKPKGVTTIMGQTLAKDLIGWAVGMAQDYLRTKLPIVTEEDIVEAGKAYMRRRDAGADTGSEAHALVENYLKGLDVDLSTSSKEAIKAYQAYKKWHESQDSIEVINVEEVIYSQRLEYAGTYDAMLNISGKNCLADLKTTNVSRKAPNGVYAEYFIQLGGYALAHNEQREYELSVEGKTDLVEVEDLVVISAKKNGKLDVVYASELGLTVDDCVQLFKAVHSIFKFLSTKTALLGGK